MSSGGGYNHGTYDLQQQAFCLSMLTCLSFNRTGASAEAITRPFRAHVENVLRLEETRKLIGDWKLRWGPVMYADAFIGAKASVNSLFLASPEAHPEQVVVAIAGTNGISLFGWMLEDFNVRDTVPWPYGETSLKPRISKGVAFGLGKLQALADRGLTARGYLAAHPELSAILVTGHSLGGALSGPYALYLENTRAEWDRSGGATIRCLNTAGQSPGDGDFSAFYGERLGATTRRVWNQLDVVPHVFHPETLLAVPTLYVPQIPAPKRIVKAIANLHRESAANRYRNILPDAAGFPSKFIRLEEIAGDKYRTFTDFIDSVVRLVKRTNPLGLNDVVGTVDFVVHGLIQHLFPYFWHLEVDEFIRIMCSPAHQPSAKRAPPGAVAQPLSSASA